MANNSAIISEIQNTIKQNGVGAIKGNDLQQVLVHMVQAVGQGRSFAGIATPSGTPSTYDRNVFWLATAAGTYTNFGGLVIPEGLSIILYNEVEGVGSYSFNTLIEIDDEPTSGSGNLVSSGAIYTAIQTAIQAVEQGATEIYDVSANNSGASYSTLAAALALVPQVLQKGGISIKYKDSTSGKYVQYRLLATSWSTDSSDWEKAGLLYNGTGQNTDGAMTQKAVTDEVIKRTTEPTYNLLDIFDLAQFNGVTINGEEAVFALSSITNKIIELDCEENEVYTLYAEAYGEGNQNTSGNGFIVVMYYTDNTFSQIVFRNDTSEFVAKSVISIYGKTISHIKLSYGTNGGNIFHVRHLMLIKGSDVSTYMPKYCSADYVARENVSRLDAKAVKKQDVNILRISNNLADPALILNGYYIVSDGRVLQTTGWSVIGIPVKQGEKYTFGGFYLGRTGYYSFYNASINNGGSVISGTCVQYGDPNGTFSVTTSAAPQDGFLYITIQTSSSPEDAYPKLQINKGETFLPYDEYESAINKMLGYDFYVKDKDLREVYESEIHRNAKPTNILPNSGYVKYTDGVLYGGGYITSDYIEVKKGEEIKVVDIYASSSVAILAAYKEVNSEKVYIQAKSLIGTNGYSSFEYTVPDDVKYVRLCCNNSFKENFSYSIIPYIPYIQVGRIASSSADTNDKIVTLGIMRDMVNPRYVTRLYPQTKLPCVSFQFDDIPAKDSQLVDLFESYGLTCAFAFIGSTSNISTKAETYANYQKKGFAIMNHSVNGTIFNTTNYTYATAQEAIMTSLNRIQNAGMVCNGFVSPSSSMASEFMPILKASHCYAFTSATTSATANSRSQNTCDLHRYSLQSNTLETIKQYIDSSITNDQIMTFYGHAADLVDNGDTTVFSLAKISAVIEYCIAKRDTNLLYIGNTDDCVKYFFDL